MSKSPVTKEEKEEIKKSKQEVKELKDKKLQLELDYIKKKNEINDAKKQELEDLEEKYHYDKLAITSPLKAEQYSLKMQQKKAHRKLNDAPRRSVLEEVGNAVSHGVGAIFAIIALVLMIQKSTDGLSLAGAIIYGTCFFFQMLFSCLYHSFRGGTKVKRIFRRFDYTSIYLEIGGTCAPLYLIYMVQKMWGLTYGLFFFIIQWTLIIIGITFVCIFGPGRIRGLHFSLFFVLGWSSLLFVPSWIRQDLNLFFWIIMGGVTYTLGMIPFAALKNKKGAHFVWHIVVLTASILMWVGIYKYVF